MFKGLQKANRVEMPAIRRVEIAEAFIQPIMECTPDLEKHYLDGTFPLSNRHRKLSLFTRALHSELSMSYKLALRDQLEGSIDPSLFAKTAHRALLFLLHCMRHSAVVYRKYPPHAWQEIHQIFTLAGLQKVERKEVSTPFGNGAWDCSVYDLYKRILLFFLCDHYRLRPRETDAIYSNLADWTTLCRLSTLADTKKPQGQFVINLKKNAPPIHLKQAQKSSGKDILVFNTQALVDAMRKARGQAKLNKLSGLNEVNGLSVRIIRHLETAWNMIPTRDQERTQLNIALDIAIGLQAIHNLITDADRIPDDRHEDEQEEEEGITTIIFPPDDINSAFADDSLLWDQDGLGQHSSLSLDVDILSASPTWAKNTNTKYHIQAFQTIDESSGGYCLDWSGKGIPKIKLGELLGLRDPDNKAVYSPAITRWMRYGKGGVTLGIQTLARRCKPVDARLWKQEQAPTRQGLLLVAEGDHPARLIAPPLAFRVDDIVDIQGSGKSQLIKIQEMTEGSGAFNIFTFEKTSREELETVNQDADLPIGPLELMDDDDHQVASADKKAKSGGFNFFRRRS